MSAKWGREELPLPKVIRDPLAQCPHLHRAMGALVVVAMRVPELNLGKAHLVAGTGWWTSFLLQSDLPKACGKGG